MTERASLSGRAAHYGTRYLSSVTRLGSRLHGLVYERFGGRLGSRLAGKPVFRLTVSGRKTGEPRSVMLMLVRRGDELLVCGSQGGSPQAPNWWKNLVAAGGGTAQVGRDIYDVDARVVTDPVEREQTWAMLTAAYPDFASYQRYTDRVLPIAVLTRRPPIG